MKKLYIFLCFIIVSITLYAVPQYSKSLENDAKNGDIKAMISLGDALMNGEGVKKNPKEALKWYEKAAKQEDPVAFHRLVEAYQSWDKVEKNPRKVEEWLKKGANAGIPSMLFEYGKLSMDEGFYYKAARLFKEAADKGYEPALPYAAFTLAVNNLPDYTSAYFYAQKALKKENLSQEEADLAYGAAALSLIEMNVDPEVWTPYLDKTSNPEILMSIAMKIPPVWDHTRKLKVGKYLTDYNSNWQKYEVFAPVIEYSRKKILDKLPQNSEEYFMVKATQDYEDLNFKDAFDNVVKAADLHNPLANIILSAAYMPNDRIAENFAIVPDNDIKINKLEASGLIFDNIWVNILSRMAIDNFRAKDEGKYKNYMFYAGVSGNPECELNAFYQNPDRAIVSQAGAIKDIVDRSKVARKHARALLGHYSNTFAVSPSMAPVFEDLLKNLDKAHQRIKIECPSNVQEATNAYINKGVDLYYLAQKTEDVQLKKNYLDLSSDYMITPLGFNKLSIPISLLCISYLRFPNPLLAQEMFDKLLDNQPDETLIFLASDDGMKIVERLIGEDKYNIVNFYKELLKQNISDESKNSVRKFIHYKYNEAI